MSFSDLLHPGLISLFFLALTFIVLVIWGILAIWNDVFHRYKNPKNIKKHTSELTFFLLVGGSLFLGLVLGILLQSRYLEIEFASLIFFSQFSYFSIIFFVASLFFVRYFFSSKDKKHLKIWVLAVALAFVFSFGFLSSMIYNGSHALVVDQTHRQQAEQIVEALRKYKTNKGGFPHDLSQLQPQYISQPFLTTEQWMYFSNSPDGFRLEYEAQGSFFKYGYSQQNTKGGWYEWNSY